MSRTINALILVALSIGIGLASAWLHLRNKGLNEPISPVRHLFFDQDPSEKRYLIAYQGASAKAQGNSEAAFALAAALSPRIILWMDVQISADGTLFALFERSLAEMGGPNQLVSFTKDEELLRVRPGLQTVKALLERYPKHRFVLNVREYRPGIDGKLAELIDALKVGERVLVQSENDGFLRDMRILRPLLLFGSSQAQITQLLMLEAMGLAPVAPLKADVYVTPAERGKASLLKPGVVAEIHRRERKVFAGPAAAEQKALLRSLGVDGLITSNPERDLDWLNSQPN